MTYQETDLIKFVFLLVATRLNPCAAFILLLHVISVFMLAAINYNPVGIYCLVSVLYCAASPSEIKISSSIRYVLFSIGALNFGAALEFHFFDYQTFYYQALPYAINALDLITILLLLTGGRGFVGNDLSLYIRERCASFNNSYFGYNHRHSLFYFKSKGKKE